MTNKLKLCIVPLMKNLNKENLKIPITPEEKEALRKNVKHLLVEQNLDLRGSQVKIARKLKVHSHALNMALTGFRKTPASIKILNDLYELLQSLPKALNG